MCRKAAAASEAMTLCWDTNVYILVAVAVLELLVL